MEKDFDLSLGFIVWILWIPRFENWFGTVFYLSLSLKLWKRNALV